MKKREKEGFEYKILFHQRKVEITTSLSSFEEVKNKLLKLSNSDKGECPICSDITRSPYQLINCKCIFCWSCLNDFVKSGEEVLYCPAQECFDKKVLINIFDFKALLPEAEFEKICDRKIRKYVEIEDRNYIICKFCENILDSK